MTPTLTPPTWSEMLMALGLGTLGGRFQDATRAVAVPIGLHDQPTRSIVPQFVLVPAELALTRAERVRALRGKYRGLAPSVDEYLRLKRLDSD